MNPRKKKILFFIATLAQGGAERLISELSFKLEDFEVVIVLSENKVSYPYRGKLIVLDVPFPKNFFSKIYCYFLRSLRMRKVLQKEKPDFLVSFGAFAHVMNVVLNRNVILHTDMFYSKARRDFWGFVLKVFARFFYSRAQKIVPVSFASAEDLVQSYGIQRKKIQVIYNPLNIEKVQKLCLEPLDPAFREIFSHPVVITMGRITRQKGQWHLIKAFKKFKETVPDAKLVIIGEGELKDSLAQLAQDISVVNDVHFLGWQNNPFPFLRASRFFVLSSLFEGLPTVLLEALACGLPVISSDCKSGPREILAPGTDIHKEAKEIEIADCGILVPPENEEILAKAMVLLYQDPVLQEQLSIKGKQRAQDFSMERILQDWKLLLHYGMLGDTKI